MGARRKARECALQIVYQVEVARAEVDDAIAKYWASFDATDVDREYAERLVRGVAEHRVTIDARLASASEHWRLDRMAQVDVAILRVATYELLFVSETPARVVLDEAIEIAKRFGTEESGGFINGILDRIAADRLKP